MCFSASLGRDEDAADIDIDNPIQPFQRGLLKLLRNGCARIVHQHVQPAEGSCIAFSTAFLTASALAESAWIATAFPPALSIALTTVAAALASFAYVMATVAPSVANRRDRRAIPWETAGNQCYLMS